MDKSLIVDYIVLCWMLWIIIRMYRVIKNNSGFFRLNYEVFWIVIFVIFFVCIVEVEFFFFLIWICFYILELYVFGFRGLNGIFCVIWNWNMLLYEVFICMGLFEGIVCWVVVWSDWNFVIFGKKLMSFVNKVYFIFIIKLFNCVVKGIRFIILKREGKIWYCRNWE